MLKKRVFVFLGILIGIVAIILIFYNTSTKYRGKPDITDSFKGYNLIIINIDALRADHLSCYGYHRNTSPFIDSLAKDGLIFKKAFSNSSYTRESVGVLFSGRLPSSSGCIGWGTEGPSRKLKSIGLLFSEAGYRTALLSSSVQLKPRNFRFGFDHFECIAKKWGESGAGPQLSSRAISFAQKNKNHKFVMYIHYLDPHGPYKPPRRFYLRFKSKIYPHPLSLYHHVRNRCHKLIESGFGHGEKRFEDMVLRYDAEIAYIDESVKLLFRGLKKLNLLDKTLVVITADHGEEFLEHNFVEHAWTLYNEVLHIPLIFWASSAINPSHISAQVSTVDLLPTLLKLMNINHRRNDFDGTSLFKYKKNGFYFIPPQKAYIGELLIQHRNLIRTVIKDNWKYIAAQKWLIPQERPKVLQGAREFEENKKSYLSILGPIIHEELYNLSTDPEEKHNNLIENKEKHHELRKILLLYKSYCIKKGIKNADKSDRKNNISKEDMKKLKSLGYLSF